MIVWIVIIVFLVLVLYLLWRMGHKCISATKIVRGASTRVIIDINTDIELLKFKDTPAQKGSKEKVEFIRRDLKKGESLEFNYPASKTPISIIVIKDGEEKTFEVDVF